MLKTEYIFRLTCVCGNKASTVVTDLHFPIRPEDYPVGWREDTCPRCKYAAPLTLGQRIATAVEIAIRHARLEDSQNYKWVIDQMLRALLGDDYAATVGNVYPQDESEETQSWSTGTEP